MCTAAYYTWNNITVRYGRTFFRAIRVQRSSLFTIKLVEFVVICMILYDGRTGGPLPKNRTIFCVEKKLKLYHSSSPRGCVIGLYVRFLTRQTIVIYGYRTRLDSRVRSSKDSLQLYRHIITYTILDGMFATRVNSFKCACAYLSLNRIFYVPW